MYGKIFESIFDSTLVAEGGWLPTYIFMSMITMADKDGYVEVAPQVLYSKLGFREYDNGITMAQFTAAVDYLCRVDTYSKSIDFDGRRIIPISQIEEIEGGRGWWIVNYDKYRNRGAREDRAALSTARSRKWREGKNPNKINDGTQGDALGRVGRHTDTDTDIKTCARFDDFWQEWPKKQRKAPALAKWKSKKLDSIADQIIADVIWRKENYKPWQDGIYMHPVTYLNQVCWEDEREDTPDLDPLAGYAE